MKKYFVLALLAFMFFGCGSPSLSLDKLDKLAKECTDVSCPSVGGRVMDTCVKVKKEKGPVMSDEDINMACKAFTNISVLSCKSGCNLMALSLVKENM